MKLENGIQRVWSFVYDDGNLFGVYYAEWASSQEGVPEVKIDFILGSWGEGTSSDDRSLVCIRFRPLPTRGFMICDSADRAAIYCAIAGRSLSRPEVLKNEALKSRLFEVLDTMWTEDKRIRWR